MFYFLLCETSKPSVMSDTVNSSLFRKSFFLFSYLFCEWCIFMYVHACSCVHMRACQVEVGGQQRLSALPVHLILFFVVFDFCMYSRLADPLGAGDPFSVS